MVRLSVVKYHTALQLGQRFQVDVDPSKPVADVLQFLARYVEINPERSTYSALRVQDDALQWTADAQLVCAVDTSSSAGLAQDDAAPLSDVMQPNSSIVFVLNRIATPAGGWPSSWFPEYGGGRGGPVGIKKAGVPIVKDDSSVSSSSSDDIVLGQGGGLFGEEEDW